MYVKLEFRAMTNSQPTRDNPVMISSIGEVFLLHVPAIVDRTAYRGNSIAEHRIRTDAAVPHGCEEVVLAHHAVAVLNQINQDVEDLRLQGDQLAATPELPTVDVEQVILKGELHAPAQSPNIRGFPRTKSNAAQGWGEHWHNR